MKRVCFFGIYDRNYSRTRTLARAFEENGYIITDCNVNPRLFKGLQKISALWREYKKIRGEKFDFVIVCFPGHSVVWLARFLFGRKVIFDAFVSLYDSNVNDRKIYSRLSLQAWYAWFLDWSSLHLGGKILVDTYEHGRYLAHTFRISTKKIIRFLIGTDSAVFYPRQSAFPSSLYTVHFHGTYIPLQGIDKILDAAYLLRDEGVQFRLIGSGQCFSAMKLYAEKLELKNVEFHSNVLYEDLPAQIALADVSLGIFGSTEKAQRVIPNKVYEGAAMGKPVITARTPAVEEVFTDGLNVILCNSTGEGIAQAILKLKAEPKVGVRIGEAAHHLFETVLSPKVLGKKLIEDITA